jgi:hypothetical protein
MKVHLSQIQWYVAYQIRSSAKKLISTQKVLAAQTRLAQELHRRPDLYEIYLVELLSVFVDKGVAIQMKAASGNHIPVGRFPVRFSHSH